MALKLKTAPASGAVTLDDAKSWLRIPDNQNDGEIAAMISAVSQKAEEWLGRALVTQTWTLWLDRFPARDQPGSPLEGRFELPVAYFDEPARFVEIPRPPLQSVVHVRTYDSLHQASILDSAAYFVDAGSEPGRIVLNTGYSWPSALRPANAVEVEFIAGYGTGSNVPEAVRQGILLWIKLLFASRSKLFETDESAGALADLHRGGLPPQVAELWSPYRLYSV